jgi:hypothetical protein
MLYCGAKVAITPNNRLQRMALHSRLVGRGFRLKCLLGTQWLDD